MLSLGLFAFASPWLLLGAAVLPVLWWLLRITPPTPKRVVFPPVRLIMNLLHREETPARTPWWLLLLRLCIAAVVILALAHPLLNPDARLAGQGPVVLVVDDGWAAAPHWQARLDTLEGLIDQAERENRPVLLLPTAPPPSGEPLAVVMQRAADARAQARAMQPKPWPVNRRAALTALNALNLSGPVESIWLSDGLAAGKGGSSAAAEALAGRLQVLGPLTLLSDSPASRPHALLPPRIDREGLGVRVLRGADAAGGPETNQVWVRASAENGAVLERQAIIFKAGETTASSLLALPLEVRNKVARLDIEGERGAGAVVLLDERWRRRPVGLVSGEALEQAQPLLAATYYLERALAPFSEIRKGTMETLLTRQTAVMILADVGQVVGRELNALEGWVESGGVLVRFAGPRLAERGDALIPVRLRRGGRALGGALSWAQPAKLARFAPDSPFADLTVPDDVVVRRQVLAEPSLNLAKKTWARLKDGTPLVTGERRGRGWVVLVHTTADASWTNLPFSGLFVDMLRRIVEMSQGVSGSGEAGALRPLAVLDGYGSLGEPSPVAAPLTAAEATEAPFGPLHPPGLYGHGGVRIARNLTASVQRLAAITGLPAGTMERPYDETRETDLKPWLLLGAFMLGLADLLAALSLRGLLRPAGGTAVRAGTAAAIALTLIVMGDGARAQTTGEDSFPLMASLKTRLAYVLTGDDEIDTMSRAGMIGLTEILTRRTAVEPATPIGVDVERDEILFFPLIYWPISPAQPPLSDAALAKLDRYMKNGGTVVFDTRDQGTADFDLARASGGPGMQRLRHLLQRLDIPPLVPIPQDHVLTKAFYLMQTFPGRWTGGTVWVERHSGSANDGVSSLLIGSHDWAAAWAMDEQKRPMAAIVPGGELQREQAYRFGVNLVMYALTGNYKADQVHVPALLERLGQ